MLTPELERIYTALWTLAREAKPPVDPVYWHAGDMQGACALFIPPQYDGQDPQIRIASAAPPDDSEDIPPPDLNGASLRELISLAHERGHEQSWRERTYPVTMTMVEERRAWSHAEKLLRALGFQEWSAFHVHKQESLDEHRRRGTPEQ